MTRIWQTKSRWLLPLLVLSCVFSIVAAVRRHFLQRKYHGRPYRAPVVVVGNITVGGSGKTPLIVALVNCLRTQGFVPGVVSRGYGGQAGSFPLEVASDTPASLCGDEPLLIASLTGCPVVVCANRSLAVTHLLSNFNCDVVLSDDGLQHYAMHRDIELIVIDGQRGLGNGYRLPAGPLREGVQRLNETDFVLVNGALEHPSLAVLGDDAGHSMVIAPCHVRQLCSGLIYSIEAWIEQFAGAERHVHAVAAIGNPQRFADTLSALDLTVTLHAYDDHQPLGTSNFMFDDDFPVLITAKDAIKFSRGGAGLMPENVWILDIEAQVETAFIDKLVAELQTLQLAASQRA
jgi:tetraacyldisaccharide 4'-kinase